DPAFKADLVAEPQVPGIERVRGNEVDYLMLVKVRPGKQYNVARELRRRIKDCFEKNNIKAGAPAQVYVGLSPAADKKWTGENMDLGLKGRGVIVAASSQGIGLGTAEAFAREGAQVAMCARTEKTLVEAADKLRSQTGAEIYAEALDVTDGNAVQRFTEQVAKRFGRIDVCVANAGGPPAKNFLSIPAEEWRKAVDLNLMSTVHLAKAVIPYMQRHRWGRIITITSISVKQPIAELILSNSVRAAVVGLVKSLSNEFGKDGILVNNVAPGFTATERLNELAATRALAAG